MDNIEALVEQFIDDRDLLSDAQLEALLAAAQNDASIAATLKDQLVIDEMLAQRLAVDRRDFVAQVAQRIRDGEPMPADLPSNENYVASQMRQLLDVELTRQQHQAQRRQTSHWRWAAGLAVLILLAAGFGWWWQNNARPVAWVESVSGAPTLVRGKQSRPVNVGDQLHADDTLMTLPQDEILVRYRDGSELRLTPDTSLQLVRGEAADGKRVDIAWGTVVAEVVPQPPGRPMRFFTPLSVATVRGTRLWISADTERTRLDVIEGVVDLRRIADERTLPVKTREYAVATSDEFVIEPLSWPVDRRDALLIFETADTTNEVRTEQGEMERIDLRPRGRARLDHDHALVVTEGSYGLFNASASVLQRCQHTNELSIEATITPRFAKQSASTCIVACSSGGSKYNFELGQFADRLFLRLRTDAGEVSTGSDNGAIELCRLTAGQPQHVTVAYRAGELVCYLNGRRVYQDGRLKGGFSNWQRLALTVGDDQRDEQDWSGTVEGLAIYDRFLEDEEVLRNAELYRDMTSRRAKIPQIEVTATLLEKSPVPAPADVLPSPSALVVCRYRVDGVLRGELAQSEVLVAQWAVLAGQPQSIADLEVGAKRQMTLERLGPNAQLAGIPRIDMFSQGDDPTKPRYFEVSEP